MGSNPIALTKLCNKYNSLQFCIILARPAWSRIWIIRAESVATIVSETGCHSRIFFGACFMVGLCGTLRHQRVVARSHTSPIETQTALWQAIKTSRNPPALKYRVASPQNEKKMIYVNQWVKIFSGGFQVDWYTAAKFLHIASAIIWLGGGLCLLILGAFAERAKDDQGLIRIVQYVIFMSNRVFIPFALATLLFGVIMVLLGQSFTDLWIIIGLAGFAWTFGIGIAVIKPGADRITALIARDGLSPDIIERCRHLIAIGKFDFILMFLIVATMVFKPATDDYAILATMVGIIVVALFVIFGGRRKPRIAAT